MLQKILVSCVTIIALASLFFIFQTKNIEASTQSEAPKQANIDHERVKQFYLDYKESANSSDYDQLLSYATNNIADDFQHYHDGNLAYGKEGLIQSINKRKKGDLITQLDIEILEVRDAEKENEVFAKIRLDEKLYYKQVSEDSILSAHTLDCSDLVRTDGEHVQLYECRCIVIDKVDNTSAHKE